MICDAPFDFRCNVMTFLRGESLIIRFPHERGGNLTTDRLQLDNLHTTCFSRV